MKDIAKQYPMLTVDERFRLFVEAVGRKDEQELDRLEATCPRRTYTAQDHAYTRKKTLFTILAFASTIQQLRVELLAITSLVVALAHENEVTDASAKTTLDAFRKFMRVRNGQRDGWLRFCGRIGVSPDAMTGTFLENVEWAMCAAEDIAETLEEDGTNNSGDADVIATRELEALIGAWGETT